MLLRWCWSPQSRSSSSISAGNVVGVATVVQTESHRLIEHLMIAANEQVARFLEARKLPALYRVHERPESMAIERMIDQLASLGVPTPPVAGGPLTRSRPPRSPARRRGWSLSGSPHTTDAGRGP